MSSVRIADCDEAYLCVCDVGVSDWCAFVIEALRERTNFLDEDDDLILTGLSIFSTKANGCLDFKRFEYTNEGSTPLPLRTIGREGLN